MTRKIVARLRRPIEPMRRMSLQGRLVLMTVGLFVAFIWALAFLSATVLRDQLESLLSGQQLAAARRVAGEVDRRLQDNIEVLTRTAAGLPADLSHELLQPLLAQRPYLQMAFSGGVAVIGRDGVAIADYPVAPGRRGNYYGDRDYFRQVVDTGKPYIDQPIIGRVLKRPVLTTAVPVFAADGRLRAVLTGITDLTAPNFLGFVTDRAQTGQGEYFVMSLRDQVIVAATDSKRALQPSPARGRNLLYDRMADGYEGSGVAVSSEGRSKLYSGVRVPTANWLILAALPTDVAFAPLATLQTYLYAIAGLLTLAAALLIRLLLHRLLAPLAEASAAIRLMTAGEAALAPLAVRHDDEIGQLVGNFNRLLDDRQNYEAALRASEQRFRDFSSSSADWFWETDAELRFVDLSENFERIFGLEKGVVLGRTRRELLARDNLNPVGALTAHFAQLDRHEAFRDFQYCMRDAAGTLRWLSVSGLPVFDAAGQFTGYRGIGQNITERKLADEALRQSEGQLRSERDFSQSLTDSLPGVFYVISAERRFLRWNESFETITDRSAGEMACIDPVDLFVDEDQTTISQRIAEVFTQGRATAEARLVTRDGPCPYFFTGRRLELDGRVLLVGLGIDVSARKAMEAELARHSEHLETMVAERTQQLESANRMLVDQQLFIRAIADAVPGLVSYWDADLRCRFANAGYMDWFGKSPAEILGMHVRELFGEALFLENEPYLQAALHGERQRFEQNLVRHDGSVRHTLRNYIPDRVDGQVRGFYVVVTDVTELKEAELQLTALNEELARRAEQAEAAMRAKSAFLANMSHEIRTPMNAVLGLARMGLRESEGQRAQAVFQRIHHSGQHLLGVINDILDYSKIEAGKLSVEKIPFAIGEVIDRAVDLTAAQAYAKGLQFEVSEDAGLPEQAVGDAMRLTQVLVNLLANALKFTERGRIGLAAARDGDCLRLRITDTGIGMSAEQLARLFTPFEQADSSTTRRFGGTGLGLAISRRIVLAMGGDIRVDSQPGRGSCVDIRLPGLSGVATAPATASTPAATAARVRLAGLPAAEAEAVAAGLRQRGIGVDVVSADAAFAPPLADPVVLAAEALAQFAGHLLPSPPPFVVTTPGVATAWPDALAKRVVVIERPLRIRHLLAPRGERLPPAAASGRLAGWRILAADDNEPNRLVLEDLLLNEGATVSFATNGRQAIDLLAERGATAFDVVLMDIQMPVMDGYAATGHLRALAPALPVIGLTAHALSEERQRSLAAGMVAHVTKPVDVDQLVAAIRQYGPDRPAAATAPLPVPAPPAAARPTATATADTLVDWAALSARFNGRQAFIDQLLATLIASYGETPAKLRQAAREGDHATLAFLAHGVKGVAGGIMAGGVAELAGKLEADARAGQEESARLAGGLASALETLTGELSARLAQRGAGGRAQPAAEALR